METKIYTDALKDEALFPAGDYSLQHIYKVVSENVNIPDNHLENRPDVNFPLWKNYIHSVRPNIARIEFLGKKMYRFS